MDQATFRHDVEGHPIRRVSPRGLVLRAVLTVLTLVAAIGGQFLTSYQLPFRVHLAPTYATLTPRPHVALPPGISAGAHAPYAMQSKRVRAILVHQNVPPGVAYPLTVINGGKSSVVTVRSIAQPDDKPFFRILNDFIIAVVVTLGLATLWRGRDWSAWGLSTFALSVLIGSALYGTPLPPFGNLVIIAAQTALGGPLPFLGLFLTANSLVGHTPRGIRRSLLIYIAVLLVMVGCELAPGFMILLTAHRNASTAINLLGGGLAVIMLAVPLVVLARGYVGAPAEQRLRIRWVLVGVVMLIPLLVTSFMIQLQLVTGSEAVGLIAAVRAIMTALLFGVFAFAVLSARLIDVRIVISRAVVFTALMALVVGCLGVSESLIERSALGVRTGLAIEVAVPLVLGALFHQLQRRIEALVDRIFFRREHQARETLRDFVRDSGFIEEPDILVARMTAVFARHAGGHGAVLYEWRTSAFERSAQHGQLWPEALDTDDPALVRLRATLAPLDLHKISGALGACGLALPLALRGRLFGVLVCGPRSAGRYAQTEIAELGQAARDVGASLFALRARANEALIERLAQGAIAPQDAHVEARQLIGLA